MSEKSAKTAKGSAMPDAISIARVRVEALAFPRGWHDTKESRRARAARMIGITARRVRAILAGEKLKLSADEYLAIERAWADATEAVASLSHLARAAEVSACRPDVAGRGSDEGSRGHPDATARGGPANPIGPR